MKRILAGTFAGLVLCALAPATAARAEDPKTEHLRLGVASLQFADSDADRDNRGCSLRDAEQEQPRSTRISTVAQPIALLLGWAHELRRHVG